MCNSVSLNDSKKLVVFESYQTYAQQLKENKDTNNLYFHIENCAISKFDLYQKGWDTKHVDEMTDEDYVSLYVNGITYENYAEAYWTKIKTSTWSYKNKYNNMCFNTLVADCEGALYYILRDEPTFLENFKKI